MLHSLTFNLLFYLAVWQWARRDCPFGAYGPGLVYSKLSDTEEVQQPKYSCIAPALDAVAFETQKWDSTNTFLNNGTVSPNRLHKEFGPPSAELDAAWAELIKSKSCRIALPSIATNCDIQTKRYDSKRTSLENIGTRQDWLK